MHRVQRCKKGLYRQIFYIGFIFFLWFFEVGDFSEIQEMWKKPFLSHKKSVKKKLRRILKICLYSPSELNWRFQWDIQHLSTMNNSRVTPFRKKQNVVLRKSHLKFFLLLFFCSIFHIARFFQYIMHPLCFLTIISSISLCVHYTLLEFSVYLGWYNYSEIHVFLHFSAFLIYSTVHIFTNILLLNPGNLSKLICSTQLNAHELSHNIILYILPHKLSKKCSKLCYRIEIFEINKNKSSV